MRTGSEAMAPSRPAGWETDLPAGARSRPESPRAGSKRMFMARPSCPRRGETQLGDLLLRAFRVLSAADPQRENPLAVVLGGRQRHVEDVHARPTERERDLGYHPGAIRDRDPQLVRAATVAPNPQERLAVGAGELVPGGHGGRVPGRQRGAKARQPIGEL